MHSVTKNWSDLSLFEWIVLVISKILKILGLQPQIWKVFSRSLEQCFITGSQNNFGNKIPLLFFSPSSKSDCLLSITLKISRLFNNFWLACLHKKYRWKHSGFQPITSEFNSICLFLCLLTRLVDMMHIKNSRHPTLKVG